MSDLSVGSVTSSQSVSDKAGLEANAPLFKRSRSGQTEQNESLKPKSKFMSVVSDIGSSFKSAFEAPLKGVKVAGGLAMWAYGKEKTTTTEPKSTEPVKHVGAKEAFTGTVKGATGGFCSAVKTAWCSYSSGSVSTFFKRAALVLASPLILAGAVVTAVGSAVVGAAKAVVSVATKPSTGKESIRTRVLKSVASAVVGAVKFVAKGLAVGIGMTLAVAGGVVLAAGHLALGAGKIALAATKLAAVGVVAVAGAALTIGAGVVGGLMVGLSGKPSTQKMAMDLTKSMVSGAMELTKTGITKSIEKLFDNSPKGKTNKAIDDIARRLNDLGIVPEPRPDLSEFDKVKKMMNIAFSSNKKGSMAVSGSLSGSKEITKIAGHIGTATALTVASGGLGAVGGLAGTINSTYKTVTSAMLSSRIDDILKANELSPEKRTEKQKTLTNEIKDLDSRIGNLQGKLDKLDKVNNPNEKARLENAISELSHEKNSKSGMKELLNSDIKLSETDIAALKQIQRTGTKMKGVGIIEGSTLTAGGVIGGLVALGLASAALGPVGLALTGTAVAIGIGVTAYKVHKVLEREDKMLTLQSQEKSVDQEIAQLTREIKSTESVLKENRDHPDLPPIRVNTETLEAKKNTLKALQGIKQEIQVLRTRVDPEFAQQQFNTAPQDSNLDNIAKAIFGKKGKDVEINDIPIFSGINAKSQEQEVTVTTSRSIGIMGAIRKVETQRALQFFA